MEKAGVLWFLRHIRDYAKYEQINIYIKINGFTKLRIRIGLNRQGGVNWRYILLLVLLIADQKIKP